MEGLQYIHSASSIYMMSYHIIYFIMFLRTVSKYLLLLYFFFALNLVHFYADASNECDKSAVKNASTWYDAEKIWIFIRGYTKRRGKRERKKPDLQNKLSIRWRIINIMSTKFRDISVCVNRFCEMVVAEIKYHQNSIGLNGRKKRNNIIH